MSTIPHTIPPLETMKLLRCMASYIDAKYEFIIVIMVIREFLKKEMHHSIVESSILNEK
jgi:hypothetical protein